MKKRRWYWLIAALLVANPALADTALTGWTLTNWQASSVTPSGQFTDVAIVGPDRVFGGFELNLFTFTFTARAYVASGVPGSGPLQEIDIGLPLDASVLSSLEARAGGGWIASAQHILPSAERRSYILDSDDPTSHTQIFGQGPAFDPDVALTDITQIGLTVGEASMSEPLVAASNGWLYQPFTFFPTRFSSVDSTGLIYGGETETFDFKVVAAIMDHNGDFLLRDAEVDGVVWDLEVPYAVGTRDGLATYWVRTGGLGGDWLPQYITDQQGTPLSGELLHMDHGGTTLATGILDDGRVIMILLETGEWFDLEVELGLPAGTLDQVVGIDSSNNRIALAAAGTDLSGWDITTLIFRTPSLPGPGALLILPLLLTGLAGLRSSGEHSRLREPRNSS